MKKATIPITKVGSALLIGCTTSIAAIEIYRWGGLTIIWGATGAIAGLLVPVLWDAWKSFVDNQKAFEGEIDRRLDLIEQSLLQKVPLSTIETFKTDLATAYAIAERAAKTADKNRDISMDTNDRVNELISSGILFALAQQVTSVQVQLEVIKKHIEKTER